MDFISPARAPGAPCALLTRNNADSPAPALSGNASSFPEEMRRSPATPRLIQMPDYLATVRQVAQPHAFPRLRQRMASGARQTAFHTAAVFPDDVEAWSGGTRDE